MFKNRTTNYFLILSSITLFFIAFILYILININDDKKLLNSLENSLKLTQNLLEEQKRYALSLSVLISEDKEFLESFNNKDRKKSFKIINNKIKKLKVLQNSSVEVQVHDKNLKTYIRSWDFNIKDIPLSSFRQGLVKVKNSLKPLTSIELGKRLNIKAITPLLENSKFIGSIEVIIGFDYLEKELKERGFETCILLHNKYLDIADTLKNNLKIQDFTLVNDKNKKANFLNEFNLNKLKDYGYFTNEIKAFSYFTIYSLNREKLGYIIISTENDEHLQIDNSYENKIINKNTRIIIE